MRVLFDLPLPFSLAHGGVQTQLQQTKAALDKIGIETDYVRWWDDQQHTDIIHYLGRPGVDYVEHAQRKGMRVIMGELLSQTGARSAMVRMAQKLTIQAARTLLPTSFTMRMAWDSFQKADACLALTPWEAHLMVEMFKAAPERVFVVPNGVEDTFFESNTADRGTWLVCTATIAPVKRVCELAEACVLAQAPIWVIGKAYAAADDYAGRLATLAKRHPGLVRYEGPVSDRRTLAAIYRQARGFVLLSKWESLSLSALEASACGCPLLLTDLPWARTTFKHHVRYVPLFASTKETARLIRLFYQQAPDIPPPPKPASWIDVARKLQDVYTKTLER